MLTAIVAGAGCSSQKAQPANTPSAIASQQAMAQQHGQDIKKAYEGNHPGSAQ